MTGASDAVAQRVESQLITCLDARAAVLEEVGPELRLVAHAARRFVLDGGKRLRPRFAYWGWRAVRSESADETDLVSAAASLELLHACALVHDDVMDASATRRGHPAPHAFFAEAHRAAGWTGDADVFGTAAAILLGDLLLSWADATFAASSAGAEARRVFDDMRQLVMAGQYLDILVQARGDFSVEDALRVARYKTSKYTIEGPLHLGAAVGGAGPEILAALSAYGLPLGEAFQLRDDVLGVFGDPAQTGKPAGDDLLEGKRTLLVALAMRAATPDQAARLRRDLGDRRLDEACLHALRDTIVATGALGQVERRIGERAAEARASLSDGVLGPATTAALDALAVAATDRIT